MLKCKIVMGMDGMGMLLGWYNRIFMWGHLALNSQMENPRLAKSLSPMPQLKLLSMPSVPGPNK